MTEKYHRNESKPANQDIAIREFAVIDREIHLKYHYEKGKVTASTRDFVKPPLTEMGDAMRFYPELTMGYESEFGVKPLRQLELFLLFKEQLKDEEAILHHVRELEDEVSCVSGFRGHCLIFKKVSQILYHVVKIMLT